MTVVAPIYTPSNTKHAYQLNWSLSLFAKQLLPQVNEWLEPLNLATEIDSVRILDAGHSDNLTLQFFISTQPHVTPSDVVRSVKGRLQYLVRANFAKAFQRNYGIFSVGETNNKCLDAYVAKQPARHPMASTDSQHRIELHQYLDDSVDLTAARASSHGRYSHNLHIVLENREHLHDASEKTLKSMRSMIVRSCVKKRQLLTRIGLASNHVHILVGCAVDESPQDVALALMNNIAYALGMKPVLEFSFYIGTFGAYDRGAIRKEYS